MIIEKYERKVKTVWCLADSQKSHSVASPETSAWVCSNVFFCCYDRFEVTYTTNVPVL